MKKEIRSGSKCPECGEEMFIEVGWPQSIEEPGEQAFVYCAECGYERPPDEKELLKIIGF